MQIIDRFPLLGVGPFDFSRLYALVRAPDGDATAFHAHSLYLTFFAEFGLVGVAAVAWTMWRFARRAAAAARASRHRRPRCSRCSDRGGTRRGRRARTDRYGERGNLRTLDADDGALRWPRPAAQGTDGDRYGAVSRGPSAPRSSVRSARSDDGHRLQSAGTQKRTLSPGRTQCRVPAATPLAPRGHRPRHGESPGPLSFSKSTTASNYDLLASSYESKGPQQPHALGLLGTRGLPFGIRKARTITASAPQAVVDQTANTVTLTGGVAAHTATGMTLHCDELVYRRDEATLTRRRQRRHHRPEGLSRDRFELRFRYFAHSHADAMTNEPIDQTARTRQALRRAHRRQRRYRRGRDRRGRRTARTQRRRQDDDVLHGRRSRQARRRHGAA